MAKTPEETQNEKERRAQLGLPAFRYHPDPLETGAFEESADGVACDCCGKTTHIFYAGPFYAVEDIDVYKRQVDAHYPHRPSAGRDLPHEIHRQL